MAGALALAGLALGGPGPGPEAASALALPSGFTLTPVFSGLSLPVAFRFAADGHVFVAEKDGVIKVFDGLNDTTATVFADLRTNVYSYIDRGLLSIEVDPQFPIRPYVYAFYSYDHVLGDPAPPPRWNDTCAGGGSGVDNGNCPASARLSRLTASSSNLEQMVPGSEQVLVEDWCQQYPIHINGTVAFGSDGALYASHGSAGATHFSDYGQTGSPLNPCGDPPVPVGGVQTVPTAEGGSLRSQDPRTPGDPYTLDGTVIRVDPNTGLGLPGNPLFASADLNARRIVAYGLRMPFRMAPRPGANEIWVGDVGEDLREEIDRISIGGPLANGGWPCYEAELVYDGFSPFNLCANLVADGPSAVLAPYFRYAHNQPAFAGDTCPNGSSSGSGLAFYPGGAYPDRYDGALFAADYGRKCIYVLLPGAEGLPDPTNVETIVSDSRGITDIHTGPGGDLYLNDIIGGTISRLTYTTGNRPPVAAITADRTNGPVPLAVQFDAGASVDPDGGVLRFEWDLDGDGQYDDSTSVTPQRTYAAPGAVDVRVRAIDPQGLAGIAAVTITAGNTAPNLTIDLPLTTSRWSVGDVINFAASSTDPDDGVLPATAFSWRLTLQHCPGSCHDHPSGSWNGVDQGSIAITGHEFPSFLDLTVTVRDSGGLETTKTVSVYPNVSTVSLTSDPSGLTVNARGSAPTPFQRSVIRGDRMSVTAPHQAMGFLPFEFDGWSDGGAQSHDIIANTDMTLRADFSVRTLRIPDRVVTEGATATTPSLPVVVNRRSVRPITVQWAFQPGTAGASDITLTTGTLTIPAGAASAGIPVSLLLDTLDEPTETFTVSLSSPTNALISDATADVQIVDNDGPQTYTYISRFNADWAALMKQAATRMGVDHKQMPRLGAQLLQFFAALDPNNVPLLNPPPAGDNQYSTTYATAAERDAVVAAATQFGLNGTHLHTVGAQVLTFLALLGG